MRYVLASIDVGDNTELRLLSNYRADCAIIEISDFTPSSTTVTLDRDEAAQLHVALTAFLYGDRPND